MQYIGDIAVWELEPNHLRCACKRSRGIGRWRVRNLKSGELVRLLRCDLRRSDPDDGKYTYRNGEKSIHGIGVCVSADAIKTSAWVKPISPLEITIKGSIWTRESMKKYHCCK